MMKRRFLLTLNCFLLISLILTACAGVPNIPLPKFIAPAATATSPAAATTAAQQQAFPPALVEMNPPQNSELGHLSPLAFYFNQNMNKASVESAISGLPTGTFTWTDEATLVFAPTAPYQSNSKLKISIANSIQSATGFGITEPIELSYTVGDFLRATNLLPKANTTDVNVEAAVSVSFNQPVVPLGADAASLPAAFVMVPSVPGRGEWINTSTYIFYPDPAMAGGTEYAVSLSQALKSVTGDSFASSEGNAWKFVTSTPQVVSVSPSPEQSIPLNPEIKLTFNQPMDAKSVETNFLLTGTNGVANGTFKWNADNTELTFVPEKLLERNVGYILNVGAAAKSRGGMALGTAYGTVLKTYDNFAVTATNSNFGVASFTFSAPLAKGKHEDAVIITPAIGSFDAVASDDGLTLSVYGYFAPDTNYVVELAASLKDQWDQSLGDPFIFNFRTAPLPAALTLKSSGSAVAFVRPDEPVLYTNITNLQKTDVTVAPLTLQDFLSLMGSYENQQAYVPANASTYTQSFNLLPSVPQDVKLSIAPQNSQLLPGLYYVNITSPQIQSTVKATNFAVSSQVNLTLKLGATEAFVWAVDLPSQKPVANAPVVLYDDKGVQLASGVTDANGIWQGAMGEREQFSAVFAVLGAPGDENFGLAINNWNMGINAYDFGYAQNIQKPHTLIYMYSDRPIYRPGQTVYFRGVAREAFNGRYQLPTVKDIPVTLTDSNGTQTADLNMQLSPYGTFNGQFDLPANATPGYYTFQNPALEFYFSVQVAEYRKPEIDLGVKFTSVEIKQGDTAQAVVNANYFFGAPAGNVKINWMLYARPAYFYIPNYQTGLLDNAWLDTFRTPNMSGSDYFGATIGNGTGQTTPKGILSIDLPAIPESESEQIVTLEVTAEDESGLPVSARTELNVHPADFYIGLHPDQWFGTAKTESGFDVYTVDWAGEASGDKTLVAEFKQVRWEKETDRFGFPKYTPVYTPVSSSNLATGPDGRARLSFTPPTAGTFMLDVSGPSSGSGRAHTQILIWVGGAESAAWADLPNQRVQLTADQDSYKAGDTAKIFIPNPFATNALALVTVERGLVSKAEVISVKGSGTEYSLPLTEDDAPNVYVSVTILGQGNDFRQGLVNIPVTPDAEKLNVQVIPNPGEAGPRDKVTFDVVVTDNAGQPVEGEFSLSVVDKAVLALADPNAQDILPAFYSNQALGIETSISLAAYSGRNSLVPGGMGGGGGGGDFFLRENFPDTAYWNPALITNAEGRGQVTMTLPDSLTTWHIDVRGLTTDTKVGQAETEIISTKPLLIRPVTPRFLVQGDHVLMAAIVNNNTASSVTAAVNLQSDGFVLDDPGKATLNLDIPANGRSRVEWWGTAGLAESADVVFSVTTSGTPSMQDSARPVWGKLPILQYTAPQAFVTGGMLRGAASQQEAISLPRTFTPTSGGLDVELSPSLAGNLLSALEALHVTDDSQSAESILSYLLPNLEVYRALNNEGLSDPALMELVTTHLNSSVSRVLSLQNADGGWSWWGSSDKSDPYISAYVFFGLQRARAAGAPVSNEVLSRVVTYLQDAQAGVGANIPGAVLDETTFIQFTLSQAGLADPNVVNALYDARERLSPASRALLAFIFNKLNPADTHARDLISNLETSAIVTSSSAHWETQSENILTRGSTIYTTSIVTYVLAQIDPANQILFNAVRYLAAHRSASGLWNLGHDNAWAIMALNEAMVGIGDLRADFAFNATLNGTPLTSGDIAGTQLTPLKTFVPLANLSANTPNLLTINREDGLGRLYYNAVLNVNRPVEDVRPLDNGMRIDRVFCKQASRSKGCAPLSSVQLASNQPISAQLTLVLPHDSYYVMVEDFIPAGMEILDRSLKTSQQGVDTPEVQVQYDDKDPFANGWGWWLFNAPQIHDDSILYSANFLPAGTYVLTYTLVPLQAGEYRVLPAHAWQSFFPEVQGTSAGAVFEIKP
ncbi:MAG: Ig-like domain-containing protein [Chloroflexota bacterium]